MIISIFIINGDAKFYLSVHTLLQIVISICTILHSVYNITHWALSLILYYTIISIILLRHQWSMKHEI